MDAFPTPNPSLSGPRAGSRLALWLHAMLALLGLWTFYSLLYWACLGALPQRDGASADAGIAFGAAGLGLITLAISGAVTPWLLDRLLRVQWIRLDEAGDVGPHLRGILEQWHLPAPYLGVVVDDDPCALTYGLTRRSARLLVTSGLLKSLDVDEQCAVVTHEAGHLAAGDFHVATLFAGPMLILAQLLGLLEADTGRFGAAAAAPAGPGAFSAGGFLAPLLAVLLRVYTFVYAGYAQCREQWADDFARRMSGEAPLQRGLLDMLERLARPAPVTRHALAVAARGFSPVDASTAGRLGTAAAWDGTLDRARLTTLARVVEANPASELAQQSALHPPIGERIPGGRGGAARVSAFTLARLFSAWLPAIGFALGFLVSVAAGGWFGLPFLLWALGRLIWLALAFGRTHGDVDNEVALHDVLEKFAAEPARAFRARVSGRVVGNGVPGQTWCPDAVLSAGQVFVAVRPRTVVTVLRPSVERRIFAPLEGQDCVVRGVLRMFDVPYLELHALDVDGRRVWSSHFILLHLLGSAALIALGLLVMAPQWIEL